MTDVLTKEQRSYCMSRIRGRDTRPEMLLRKALWGLGFRYRLKNTLPGKPDIVFPSRRVVIFVDGCFWHKCPQHFQVPANNRDFWNEKINSNVLRDQKINETLKQLGWKVIRLWEHELKKTLPEALEKVIPHLVPNEDRMDSSRK